MKPILYNPKDAISILHAIMFAHFQKEEEIAFVPEENQVNFEPQNLMTEWAKHNPSWSHNPPLIFQHACNMASSHTSDVMCIHFGIISLYAPKLASIKSRQEVRELGLVYMHDPRSQNEEITRDFLIFEGAKAIYILNNFAPKEETVKDDTGEKLDDEELKHLRKAVQQAGEEKDKMYSAIDKLTQEVERGEKEIKGLKDKLLAYESAKTTPFKEEVVESKLEFKSPVKKEEKKGKGGKK